jgi:hypothetical protein
MMDRLQAWFTACVAKAVEQLPYAGEYRYSVVSCDFAAQTLDLRALDRGDPDDDNDMGQPDLIRVPMRTPGIRLDVAPGAEVLVGYASMKATRPEVRAYDTRPGTILRAELLGGTTPVALQGMSVEVTIPINAIATTGTAAAQSGPSAIQGPVTVTGTITGGSATIAGTP